MEIVKSGDKEFRVTVTAGEARILANCMKAALAEIMTSEFQTRVGSRPEDIGAILIALDKALKPA